MKRLKTYTGWRRIVTSENASILPGSPSPLKYTIQFSATLFRWRVIQFTGKKEPAELPPAGYCLVKPSAQLCVHLADLSR